MLFRSQMPVMDGVEALSALRTRDAARAAHTPVIAVTAHASKSDVARCLAAGFDGFVSKPVHANWLSWEMHRVLERATP